METHGNLSEQGEYSTIWGKNRCSISSRFPWKENKRIDKQIIIHCNTTCKTMKTILFIIPKNVFLAVRIHSGWLMLSWWFRWIKKIIQVFISVFFGDRLSKILGLYHGITCLQNVFLAWWRRVDLCLLELWASNYVFFA